MFQLPPLPRNLEASFRDLDSTKSEVRVSAVADVTRHALTDDRVLERAKVALRRVLGDISPRVRGAAAVALADLRDSDSLAQLLLFVEDDDAYVRQMALTALGEIGDVRAKARVLRATTDARPDVRYQAIIAFSRLECDPHEKLGVLRSALADDDVAVVHIALRVVEEELTKGLVLDDASKDAIGALCTSPSSNVRVSAAIVLGRESLATGRPLPKASRDLLLAAARGDRIADPLDKEDEQGAIELVGELGLREALPGLERRVFGLTRFIRDTSTFHARIALARMGHARAKRAIHDGLGDRGEAQIAAVIACGRARLHDERPALEALLSAASEPLRSHVTEALGELAATRDVEQESRA